MLSWTADVSKWDVAKGKSFANMVSVARTNGGGVTSKLARAAMLWAGAASLAHRRAPRALAASQFGSSQYFNADLSKWDVAKGENFEAMFYNTDHFNADLSDWDVAKGQNFKDMVRLARPRGSGTLRHIPPQRLPASCAPIVLWVRHQGGEQVRRVQVAARACSPRGGANGEWRANPGAGHGMGWVGVTGRREL